MSNISNEDATAADAAVDFMVQRRQDDLDSDSIDAALIDLEGICYADYRVEQYAQGIVDWSTQYGSYYSISYTAQNITGRPSKFPEYGDFPETYAMRTYGDWWNKAPSRVKDFQAQNLPKIPTHDFIVIYFEDYLIPDELAVFETFNPGAVVRIWAYTIVKTWILLWEATELSKNLPNRSRCFTPTLKKSCFPTKTIRLEFNHSHLNYLTEIDAVLLSGRSVNMRFLRHLMETYEKRKSNGSIVRKLQNMKFRPDFQNDYEQSLQTFLENDLEKFIELELKTEEDAQNPEIQTKVVKKTTFDTGLKDLPFEIVLKIFGYLDLISLFRVGQVSRFFYDVSTQPLLYSELNLKPYWHLTTTELLSTLAKRATVLKKLDLSWCGLYNSISPTEFKKFIQQRGDSLTHLRLNSCKFLNASCIETLGIVCDDLKELSLRNCSTDPPLLNFSCLANLKNLERLDLFQTVIEPELLLTMLESNRKLKHLNLAFSGVSVNMDTVAQQIGNFNQQLVSLDMWKSHFLTASGLLALSKCHDLEEIDFGWCLREISLGDSLQVLLSNCPKLKKVFLATVRSITDRDVEHIANLCPNLEQLDLMGVIGISKERYYDILLKCKKLQLLDLSFCDNIDERELLVWSHTFNVNIKCSHLSIDIRH